MGVLSRAGRTAPAILELRINDGASQEIRAAGSREHERTQKGAESDAWRAHPDPKVAAKARTVARDPCPVIAPLEATLTDLFGELPAKLTALGVCFCVPGLGVKRHPRPSKVHPRPSKVLLLLSNNETRLDYRSTRSGLCGRVRFPSCYLRGAPG